MHNSGSATRGCSTWLQVMVVSNASEMLLVANLILPGLRTCKQVSGQRRGAPSCGCGCSTTSCRCCRGWMCCRCRRSGAAAAAAAATAAGAPAAGSEGLERQSPTCWVLPSYTCSWRAPAECPEGAQPSVVHSAPAAARVWSAPACAAPGCQHEHSILPYIMMYDINCRCVAALCLATVALTDG